MWCIIQNTFQNFVVTKLRNCYVKTICFPHTKKHLMMNAVEQLIQENHYKLFTILRKTDMS